MADKAPDIRSLESAANTLRGVNLHLSVFKARGLVDLEEPMKAIEESIAKIDAFTEEATDGR